MAHQFTTSYVEESLALFRNYKKLTERAMAQVPEESLNAVLDEESNSIAVIIKHMAGNMRSRWTDFLTTDGEKADRHRDNEFEEAPAGRAEVLALWEAGWAIFLGALEGLSDADLGKTVFIRGEAHSVMQAISRQMGHYTYHCGQIVLLAKHYSSVHWQAVTIPRNRSEEFNRAVVAG